MFLSCSFKINDLNKLDFFFFLTFQIIETSELDFFSPFHIIETI